MVLQTRPTPHELPKVSWRNVVQLPGERVKTNWEAWFAWLPVTLEDGSKVWLKRIYRRESWRWGMPSSLTNFRYEYSTLFDVLRG